MQTVFFNKSERAHFNKKDRAKSDDNNILNSTVSYYIFIKVISICILLFIFRLMNLIRIKYSVIIMNKSCQIMARHHLSCARGYVQ